MFKHLNIPTMKFQMKMSILWGEYSIQDIFKTGFQKQVIKIFKITNNVHSLDGILYTRYLTGFQVQRDLHWVLPLIRGVRYHLIITDCLLRSKTKLCEKTPIHCYHHLITDTKDDAKQKTMIINVLCEVRPDVNWALKLWRSLVLGCWCLEQ